MFWKKAEQEKRLRSAHERQEQFFRNHAGMFYYPAGRSDLAITQVLPRASIDFRHKHLLALAKLGLHPDNRDSKAVDAQLFILNQEYGWVEQDWQMYYDSL